MLEQEKKIKELEVELVSKVSAESSLRKTIEDTQKSNAEKEKLSQNKINEIQSKCDDSDKKIKGLQTQLESKTKEAFTFQEKVSKLEAAQKDSIDKNIHLKEMQSLKEKHEKEVKAKNEKAEAEINRLKADTEDLAKQLYNGKQTVLRLQSEIREFNDELTDSKSNEEKLKSNIAHLRSTCVNIAEYDKKIEELKTKKLPFYLAMDEIRDGSARDRLGSNTVVEVTKLAYSSGCLNLFSTFEPFEKPFKFKLSNEKPYFKIQINDELEIKSDADKGLSDTLSFIHSCNLTKLDYGRTCINYTDFIKLVSSHTITSFIGGNVVREINGKIKVFVGIAEILKELPNIETCEIHFSSSPDCQKLDELPIFSNLQKFSLHLSNRSMFNIEAFAEFIKKHQNVKFS
uniref:Uncharacterized protein n=1 Tax=Panagrolaimus superbus TaxID=310955 RepID=A0A914Y281_9BILA